MMINTYVWIGMINIIFGVCVIIFRDSFSGVFRSPGGFGAKSLKEKYGKKRGKILMILFGLLVLFLGLGFLAAGILD